MSSRGMPVSSLIEGQKQAGIIEEHVLGLCVSTHHHLHHICNLCNCPRPPAPFPRLFSLLLTIAYKHTRAPGRSRLVRDRNSCCVRMGLSSWTRAQWCSELVKRLPCGPERCEAQKVTHGSHGSHTGHTGRAADSVCCYLVCDGKNTVALQLIHAHTHTLAKNTTCSPMRLCRDITMLSRIGSMGGLVT
jgi:hypothetical protein